MKSDELLIFIQIAEDEQRDRLKRAVYLFPGKLPILEEIIEIRIIQKVET